MAVPYNFDIELHHYQDADHKNHYFFGFVWEKHRYRPDHKDWWNDTEASYEFDKQADTKAEYFQYIRNNTNIEYYLDKWSGEEHYDYWGYLIYRIEKDNIVMYDNIYANGISLIIHMDPDAITQNFLPVEYGSDELLEQEITTPQRQLEFPLTTARSLQKKGQTVLWDDPIYDEISLILNYDYISDRHKLSWASYRKLNNFMEAVAIDISTCWEVGKWDPTTWFSKLLKQAYDIAPASDEFMDAGLELFAMCELAFSPAILFDRYPGDSRFPLEFAPCNWFPHENTPLVYYDLYTYFAFPSWVITPKPFSKIEFGLSVISSLQQTCKNVWYVKCYSDYNKGYTEYFDADDFLNKEQIVEYLASPDGDERLTQMAIKIEQAIGSGESTASCKSRILYELGRWETYWYPYYCEQAGVEVVDI